MTHSNTSYNLHDLKTIRTEELFNVFLTLHAAEQRPNKLLADTWFNETITKMTDVSLTSLNEAFLYAARLELDVPRWWLVQWSKHNVDNFKKLSITDLANGLYSLALLRIQVNQVRPFLEKCVIFFKSKRKGFISVNQLGEYIKIVRSYNYFRRKHDFDLHFKDLHNYELTSHLERVKDKQNQRIRKTLNNYLQQIFYYPPDHIINQRSKKDDDDMWLDEIDYDPFVLDREILEATQFRIVDRRNLKFLYKKSKFDRDTLSDIKLMCWHEDLGDYVDIILPEIMYINNPTMEATEPEPDTCTIFSEIDEIINRYKNLSDAAILLLNKENYFQGNLNADTKLDIELLESNNCKTILIDSVEFDKKGIQYVQDIFSLLLPFQEIKERIKEYPLLIEKKEDFNINYLLKTINADDYFSSIKILYRNKKLQESNWFNEWLTFSQHLMFKVNISHLGAIFCDSVLFGLKPTNMWLSRLCERLIHNFSLLSIEDVANFIYGFSLLGIKSEDLIPFLEQCKNKLNTIKSTEIDDIKVYQKLCKSIFFYTDIECFKLKIPYISIKMEQSNNNTDSTDLNVLSFLNKVFQYPSDHPYNSENKENYDQNSLVLDDTVIYLKSNFERDKTFFEKNVWNSSTGVLIDLVIRKIRTKHIRRDRNDPYEDIRFIFVSDKDYTNQILNVERAFDILLLKQNYEYVYVLNLDLFHACGDLYLKHFLKKFMWESDINGRLQEFDRLICDKEDDVPDSYKENIIQNSLSNSNKKVNFDPQATEELFKLIQKRYSQEVKLEEEELNEWFRKTQSIIAHTNPTVVNEALLHLVLFDIKPPFWWISNWHKYMHLKFNRLSISSIINGLYAIALLKIDPKHLMPFINKCQKYFKEKDRMLFSENDVVNYEKSIILNLYFKENNINLYINQSQKSQVECKLIESCSDQTEEISNEISDYLSKIFEYPRNHLCHEKVNHSDSDDYFKHYKKHVDLIEKNEIFHAETYKYKFMYKKSNFNRYEKTIRKGFVKNGIGNCVNRPAA